MSVQIKEGALAYKRIKNRRKGLSIQDLIDEAFKALDQVKRPETKEEKAKDINQKCQLKITELFPSATPVYQFAGILLYNIIRGTTVPERTWKLYREEIESAIKSGIPANVSGTPATPPPERLSAAWFEREIFYSAGMLRAYSNDPGDREFALNRLNKLKEEATELQKTKPYPEINSVLEKINAAINCSNPTHPMKE